MVQKNFPKPVAPANKGMFSGMQRRLGRPNPGKDPVIARVGKMRTVQKSPAQAIKSKAAANFAAKTKSKVTGLQRAASGPAGVSANYRSRVAQVATKLNTRDSVTAPMTARVKAAMDKNSIGQTGSEQAMIRRGIKGMMKG